tara:strand:- start:22133 stop:22552 length:420 start_codon:yes stop_codon:yes gene_type:complete
MNRLPPELRNNILRKKRDLEEKNERNKRVKAAVVAKNVQARVKQINLKKKYALPVSQTKMYFLNQLADVYEDISLLRKDMRRSMRKKSWEEMKQHDNTLKNIMMIVKDQIMDCASHNECRNTNMKFNINAMNNSNNHPF